MSRASKWVKTPLSALRETSFRNVYRKTEGVFAVDIIEFSTGWAFWVTCPIVENNREGFLRRSGEEKTLKAAKAAAEKHLRELQEKYNKEKEIATHALLKETLETVLRRLGLSGFNLKRALHELQAGNDEPLYRELKTLRDE